MERYTKKQIDKAKERLQQASKYELSIKDRYSTNYEAWIKACNKVNRLRNKVNKMIRAYNYDNGCVGVGVFVGSVN